MYYQNTMWELQEVNHMNISNSRQIYWWHDPSWQILQNNQNRRKETDHYLHSKKL